MAPWIRISPVGFGESVSPEEAQRIVEDAIGRASSVAGRAGDHSFESEDGVNEAGSNSPIGFQSQVEPVESVSGAGFSLSFHGINISVDFRDGGPQTLDGFAQLFLAFIHGISPSVGARDGAGVDNQKPTDRDTGGRRNPPRSRPSGPSVQRVLATYSCRDCSFAVSKTGNIHAQLWTENRAVLAGGKHRSETDHQNYTISVRDV